MGCFSSKPALKAAASPGFDYENGVVILEDSLRNPTTKEYEKKGEDRSEDHRSRDNRRSRRSESSHQERSSSFSFRLGFSHRYVEAEQVAAGWPSWLSNAAGEAVHGWVPLRADSFEKLEKIGQGTYSSVFRARQVETGRMVALKKVRFDNFQPESIRFMAREIMILRRLDHPNIMQLEGIITSKLSSSIYLVFEYMEHDLAGLVSSPAIDFSDAQIKCYMRQLLSAIEHCHLRGIMHRDIKSSNILVNNEGVLKLADFGLANVLNSKHKHPLTSRVVTLWYRPPELLMGSTDYGLTVDLWSIGCVFAELQLGKPILKGRTEVEQLHKIFKLCGSPAEEFWRKTKLPHAAMFKPQHTYESSLRDKCTELPSSAVSLLETFLAVEPYKRGTASSALISEYFRTRPYACDPATLPKYPPSKEIDAKIREDARRKRATTRARETGATLKARRARRNLQEMHSHRVPLKEDMEENIKSYRRNNGGNTTNVPKGEGACISEREPQKPSYDTTSLISQDLSANNQKDSAFTVPIQVSASSGFAWVKKRKEEATSTISDGLKSQISALDPSFANYTKKNHGRANIHANSEENDMKNSARYDISNQQRRKYDISGSFDASDEHPYMDTAKEFYPKPQSNVIAQRGKNDQGRHIQFSGPLLSESHRIDELLQRNESHIRRAARKSRFEREK